MLYVKLSSDSKKGMIYVMNLFSHNERTEWLLLAWADKHPILFTIIEVTNPTLFAVVASVSVISIVSNVIRRGRR